MTLEGPDERSLATVPLLIAQGAFLAGVVLLPMMKYGTWHALGAVVIPADVCFVVAGACLVLAEILRRGRDLRGPFPVLALAYLVAMVLATAASSDRRESLERNVIDAYCVAIGMMSFALARSSGQRLRIAWAWLAGTAITVSAALIGIVLFYLGARVPSENFAIGQRGSIHTTSVPRVVGFFINPNMFCSYLIVGLLFALAVVGWRRPAGIVLLGAIGIALAFTMSPGLGGAILAATLWLAASEREHWPTIARRVVIAVGIVGAVAFFVLTLRVGGRVHTWSDAFETFADRPLLGVGPGVPVADSYFDGQVFTDAHNAWLNVAGQGGLVALLGFLGVVGGVVVLAWRARPVYRLPEPVRAGWFAFVGVVLYGSISLSLEQTRHVWVLMGVVAAGLWTVSRRTAASSSPRRSA